MTVGLMIVGGLVGLILLLCLFDGWYTTEQGWAKVLQRLGNHRAINEGGFAFKIPVIDRVVGRLSTRIQQTEVPAGTITSDQVEINIGVAVQYVVTDVFKAWYQLSDPQAQIRSWVESLIRAEIPKMTLEEVYSNKDRLTEVLKAELNEHLDEYGWKVVSVPVNEVSPDSEVIRAMSDKRKWALKAEAAEKEGEAIRVKLVAEARANKEKKELDGEGIALQREAIANGLRRSAETIKSGLGHVNDDEVLRLLMLERHFETQVQLASSASDGTRVIFIPSGPGALGDATAQLRNSVLAADAASMGVTAPTTPPTTPKA